MHWIEALGQLRDAGEAHVLVSVLSLQGSGPRAVGSKMVVSAEQCYDSIGGGHLEHRATEMARELLQQREPACQIETFNLSAHLGQCCGGRVSLLLEPFVLSQPSLVLFGAGHVAQALVKILAELPWRVRWVDAREQFTPEELPRQIQFCLSDPPEREVDLAPDDSHYLVMTHDHGLDLQLCERILRREDRVWCGLIGSKAKAQRFRKRLGQRGLSADALARLHCPVGLPEVPGKRPMEVAVAVAGALIQQHAHQAPLQGPSMAQIRTLTEAL